MSFCPLRAGVSPGYKMLQDCVALDQEKHPEVLGIWACRLRALRHQTKVSWRSRGRHKHAFQGEPPNCLSFFGCGLKPLSGGCSYTFDCQYLILAEGQMLGHL